MQYLDSSLIGPAMLFLNQYFNFFIKEYYVLWLCFVSLLHATCLTKWSLCYLQYSVQQIMGYPCIQIWVTLDLLRYSAQVCLEICDHMKIKLFRIPCNQTSTIQVSNAEKNGTNRSQRNRLHKKHHQDRLVIMNALYDSSDECIKKSVNCKTKYIKRERIFVYVNNIC